MSNDFHIDLFKDFSGGDVVGPAIPIKSGANSLNVTASNLDGGSVILEFRPIRKDGASQSQWYRKPAGTFTVAELDGNDKAWDNVLLGEGHVRGVLENSSGNAVIEEMLIRPTHETEIDI